MAQSYANQHGSGDRQFRLRSYTSVGFYAGPGGCDICLNGSTGANNTFFSGGTVSGSVWQVWDFGSPRILDEVKFYQSNTTSHGVWQWQGSADASSWTSIGATFTLGSTGTQTITTMSANVTGYRYYRLLGVSGTMSNGPFVRQWEFKLDVESATDLAVSYYDAQSKGDRSASITATHNTGFNYVRLIDGGLNFNGVDATSWAPGTGQFAKFDFGAAKCLRGCRYFQQNTTNQGTFKWQGSPDNSAWTDVGTTFTLGPTVGAGDTANYQEISTLESNTDAYRYWRMISTAGTQTDGPWVSEFLFKVGDAPPTPPVPSRPAAMALFFF